ncbi:MAG: winged helix-turn-helix domain-containing protein [Thermoplasmatota archaeon]
MATPIESTRWRVYVALRDGAAHGEAARLLGITRPTVEHHADQLVSAGRLVREDRQHGHRAKYRRGPRAMLYEAHQNLPKPRHEGRAPSVCPEGARVHRGEFKVRVAPYGAHLKQPPVEKTWKASGTTFREWWHETQDGRRVRVRECKGDHNCSLILQPEEEFTNGPAEVDALEVVWARRVDDAMADLAALYGYQRASIIQRSTPIEYEWESPALVPGAHAQAKDGGVWTDRSTGPTSIETDSQRVAVAVAGLPEHLADDAAQKRDLLARLDALQHQAEQFRGRAINVPADLFDPIVRVLEAHGRTLAELLGAT